MTFKRLRASQSRLILLKVQMSDQSYLPGSAGISLTHDTHEVMKTKPAAAPPRVKGDPRDDSFVVKYDKANFSEGQQGASFSDLYQMASVLIGMYAFTMKARWACWASLFLFYTSVINAKSEGRIQQMFTGFSIILISFVNIYLAPARPPHMQEPQQPEIISELPAQ